MFEQSTKFAAESHKQPPAVSVLKKYSLVRRLNVPFFCKELILRKSNFAGLSFRENSNCLRFT